MLIFLLLLDSDGVWVDVGDCLGFDVFIVLLVEINFVEVGYCMLG